MTKLSFATALILGTALFASAADDLASAFKEGKLDGRLRANFISTDWDTNDWGTKPDGDSRGLAVGGSLIYKTTPLYGFSAGAGFYTTQDSHLWTDTTSGTSNGYPKSTTGTDLFARGPGAATTWGDGYSVLAQSYLQYDIAKSKIKGGRFLMTNPWITPNDTKMIPIAIEGFDAVSNDLPNTTVQLDYADKIKERGMTYFGSMADTGDTPDAIKNYYRTHYTATTNASTSVPAAQFPLYGSGGEAPAVKIIGVKNKSINALEVQGWFMNWPNIVNQGMLEANYAIEAGDVIFGLGARYMKQYDKGAGDIITPGDGSSPYSKLGVTNTAPTGSKASDVNLKGDNDNSVDTYLYAVRTTASYGAGKLMLAYSHTGSGGDMIAPWRGFPTDGYTRSMTQTDWNANTKAYKAQIDYDFNALIQGVSTILSYSFYNRDESKIGYQGQTDRYYNNGDTRQWNLDVKYDVPAVKGLELKVREMYQHNSVLAAATTYGTAGTAATKSEGFGNDTSNHELRLEANYRF
ncbi:MAG: OprD family outer membrane porin [Sulfuricurvum sp.]|nr:OprD family outer membrane porin [Sulfuricurvum sp.]